MRKTGFATIGTSKITEKFLQASKEYPEFQYVAAYSRDIKKAEEFAGIHGAEKAYNSLDMLSEDPEVEAVYVATPNHMHYEQVMKLLNAGNMFSVRNLLHQITGKQKRCFNSHMKRNSFFWRLCAQLLIQVWKL